MFLRAAIMGIEMQNLPFSAVLERQFHHHMGSTGSFSLICRRCPVLFMAYCQNDRNDSKWRMKRKHERKLRPK
jgi:hypothetical protein